MSTLTGPRLEPASGPAKSLIVLLHGYGASGADLIGLADFWRPSMPATLFVAPDAPQRCSINPAGFEWFDLAQFEPHRIAELATAARPPVARFLEALWSETGLGAAETVLCGFSQGAMMALEVGLRLDRAVQGIVGFSGALPGGETLAAEIRSRPPVCLVHGDADPVVPYGLGLAAAKSLEELGVSVAFHTSRGAGHGIAEDGLSFATAFISGLAAPPANGG